MELETKRLLMRDFTPDDFAAVHAYASDPEVVRYLAWGPNSEAETVDFLTRASASASVDPRTDFNFAVVERRSGNLVGGAGIYVNAPGVGMIGYCFAKEVWGRGLATEAARALVRFGFEALDLHRIWAGCDPDNRGSVRILEKVGMRQEGRLRQDTDIRGEWRDTLVFGVLEGEWRS